MAKWCCLWCSLPKDLWTEEEGSAPEDCRIGQRDPGAGLCSNAGDDGMKKVPPKICHSRVQGGTGIMGHHQLREMVKLRPLKFIRNSNMKPNKETQNFPAIFPFCLCTYTSAVTWNEENMLCHFEGHIKVLKSCWLWETLTVLHLVTSPTQEPGADGWWGMAG